MISPLLTDRELLRACKFVESHLVRTVADRLQHRINQLDYVYSVATSNPPDPSAALADIAEQSKRE